LPEADVCADVPVEKPNARQKLEAYGMDRICERTAECMPQRKIAMEIEVSWATMMAWIDNDKTRTEQYARAREAQADKLAEDLLAIADEEVTMVKRSKHQPGAGEDDDMGDIEVCFDPTAVARNRLRVDARKWLASKMAPKKYGEKTVLSNDPESPITGNQPVYAIPTEVLMAIAKNGASGN